ncbi:HeH/LEM domain-containing protein [Massilia sp. BKSP1R2A-1]|uniref:HeH/LEM domain-containing protein n=1 Tax=Massilia sp. BKSP1R2A-1 TaxID=3422595 RepID=UPI003D33F7B4
MKLIAKAAFSWAHRGVQVEHFAEGQVIETDDQDLIDVSEREGWTEREGAKNSARTPVPDAAPALKPEPELENVHDPAPALGEAAPAPTGGRRKK